MSGILRGIEASPALEIREYLPSTVHGSERNDALVGRSGDDRVIGGEGHEGLYGQDGNDRLFGNGGNDAIYGGNGNDKLDGGSGNDALVGESGNDALSGGSGNDLLMGGAGNDFMVGGDGADVFYAFGGGHDVIQDFNPDEGDTIDLTGASGHSLKHEVLWHGTDIVMADGTEALRIDLNDGSDLTLVGVSRDEMLYGHMIE